MANLETAKRQGLELSVELLRAMRQWSDGGLYDARVPVIGLFDALMKCLRQLPEDRRKVLAREFAEGLFKEVGLHSKIVDAN